MHRSTLLVCLLVLGMATLAWSESPQRGQRGGPGLTEEHVLENFGEIVELIWTDEEEDAWDAAETDEERQAFITAFWAERDPTPGTEANEFRDIYMGRVDTAMRQFSGEGTEGYRTARGRFLIIYGGNAIVAQQRKEVAGSARGGVGQETSGAGSGTALFWEINTEINPFLEGKEEVVFNQYQRSFSMSTGGIRLDQEAFLANTDVQECFASPASCAVGGRPPAGGGAAAGGAAPSGGAAEAGAGAAAPMTPDRAAMGELLNAGTTRSDLAFQQQVDFFPAPENNVYTVVGFEVGKEGLSMDAGPAAMTAFGVILEQTETGENLVREMRIPFTISADEGTAEESGTHTFGLTLAPGSYRLAWGVMDDASEAVTTTDVSFQVPDYAAGPLQLAGPLVATGAPQESQAPIDIDTIYHGMRLGNLLAPVDLDNAFGRNDSFVLLYFVMGARQDPATQQYSIEVEHRVLDAEGNGVARLPVNTLDNFIIQQEIPLGQVPELQAGDHQVEIRIKDNVTGNEITETVPFTVTAEDR